MSETKSSSTTAPAPSAPVTEQVINTPDMEEVEEAEVSEKLLVPILPIKSLKANSCEANIKKLSNLLTSSSKRDNLLSLTSYALQLYIGLRPSQVRLAKLRGLIADYRIAARLLALPGLYTWLISVIESPPADPILRAVAIGEVLSCLLYQLLENVAYLAGRGIITLKGKNSENKAWLWSSRFWAAYVMLEFVRLGREWSLGQRNEKEERPQWWRDVISNLSWAPLTVHWSLEKGLIPDVAVGFFGTIAGLISVERAWKSTV